MSDARTKPQCASTVGASQGDAVPLDNSDLYINRELSWLDFNARVLEEAQDSRTPLRDSIKCMALFSSTLD